MIADVDGRLRFVSPCRRAHLRACTRTTWSGRNLLDLWGEADRDRLAAFLARSPATHGKAVGPVEVTVGSGPRRYTLESVGSNLLDDPAIGGLALNFRDVSERKALEEQLRQLAFHDPLTLLANRSLFRNRVQHALTLAQRVAPAGRGDVPGPRQLQERQRLARATTPATGCCRPRPSAS